jgi:dTMP kinase
MFITFEGIDGSGKSTQIDLLETYLANRGIEVIKLREPGGTLLSEQIRGILLHSKNEISPVTELLMFNAARSCLVDSIIRPALQSGKTVICDRFYDSTTTYQGYGRGLPLEDVRNCNMIATGGLKPDITLYLEIPLYLSIDRTNHRSQDRMEKSGNEFFRKVIEGFNQIAIEEPERFIKIDASRNIDEVHSEIVKNVENKLKK